MSSVSEKVRKLDICPLIGNTSRLLQTDIRFQLINAISVSKNAHCLINIETTLEIFRHNGR